MLLYAHTLTPRLRYITHWFAAQFLHDSIECTDSIEKYQAHTGHCLNYSKQQIRKDECWIQPVSLLFESDLRPIVPDLTTTQPFPVFFCTEGEMGFDVFAASFYLISRYEEYLPYTTDAYGRFPHTQSVAFRHQFLERPLVDEWMLQFAIHLQTLFPSLAVQTPRFEHLATYDIDESFAYRHKPLWLQAAGLLRDLFAGRLSWVAERIRVLQHRAADPYDAVAFMRSLHSDLSTRPISFLLVAQTRSKYDKNLSPDHPAQRACIRLLSEWSEIALHPSWQSGDKPNLLMEEKQKLESILNGPITRSRQHYIRFRLPDTYRLLITAGLTADYSMGYGSINGFRASTARSFQWFDLKRNEVSSLLVHPFCYMEANSFYEQHHTIEQAELQWKQLEKAVRQSGGTLITVWHNTILGTQTRFAGWRQRYAQWIRSMNH